MANIPYQIKLLLIAFVAIALVGFGYACASFRKAPENSHFSARQFVIQSTLVRFPNSIVVLGDSIVEGSTLPRSVCGHAIINAGIGGASTKSDLGTVLKKSLAGKLAALVIISLGTNDAAVARDTESFGANYSSLLKQISALTSRTIVMAIPPVEEGAEMSTVINSYNSALPWIVAREANATFANLPAMPAPHTIDGVHLNTAGYEIWETAVLQQAATICGS